MRPEQVKANGLARVFGQQDLQTNWSTVTLELSSADVAGASAYPTLNPGTSADSRFRFQIDAVLLGVNFSVTWITANANESACIAVAPKVSKLRALSSQQIYYQSSIFCFVGVTAAQIIQRNPGFMFPPPLVKYIQAGTTLQLYGTAQTAVVWKYLATLYYVTVADYLKLMEMSVI